MKTHPDHDILFKYFKYSIYSKSSFIILIYIGIKYFYVYKSCLSKNLKDFSNFQFLTIYKNIKEYTSKNISIIINEIT